MPKFLFWEQVNVQGRKKYKVKIFIESLKITWNYQKVINQINLQSKTKHLLDVKF